jgi:hypothetical protein
MPVMKKVCPVCQHSFFTKRNPAQCYCHRKECQRFRKNQWRRQKRQQDADYRENQRQAQHRWRQQHTDYWRQYRASHPDYQQRHREQQRQRDALRRHSAPAQATNPPLAKSDVLKLNLPIPSGTYNLVPANASLLAKSDVFRVKITLISEGYSQ